MTPQRLDWMNAGRVSSSPSQITPSSAVLIPDIRTISQFFSLECATTRFNLFRFLISGRYTLKVPGCDHCVSRLRFQFWFLSGFLLSVCFSVSFLEFLFLPFFFPFLISRFFLLLGGSPFVSSAGSLSSSFLTSAALEAIWLWFGLRLEVFFDWFVHRRCIQWLHHWQRILSCQTRLPQTLHCSPGPGFCSTSPASNSKYRARSAGSSDSITKNPVARAEALDILACCWRTNFRRALQPVATRRTSTPQATVDTKQSSSTSFTFSGCPDLINFSNSFPTSACRCRVPVEIFVLLGNIRVLVKSLFRYLLSIRCFRIRPENCLCFLFFWLVVLSQLYSADS